MATTETRELNHKHGTTATITTRPQAQYNSNDNNDKSMKNVMSNNNNKRGKKRPHEKRRESYDIVLFQLSKQQTTAVVTLAPACHKYMLSDLV
jgi:hypothetical protein